MPLPDNLLRRSNSTCELCMAGEAKHAFTVSPKEKDILENEVALCNQCLEQLQNNTDTQHWRCLEGSIWNTEASVQALSYRILYGLKNYPWADEILNSVDLDENVVNWAMDTYKVEAIHKDGYGVELLNGDTVILTQVLNVKGTSFMAPKGTVVRKIRLVPDNTDQIEGKINDQTIVILTKFVRKQAGS